MFIYIFHLVKLMMSICIWVSKETVPLSSRGCEAIHCSMSDLTVATHKAENDFPSSTAGNCQKVLKVGLSSPSILECSLLIICRPYQIKPLVPSPKVWVHLLRLMCAVY